MRQNRSRQAIHLFVSIMLMTLVFSLTAAAKSVTVDCSGQTPGAFTSIQSAIDSVDNTGPNQVFIVPGIPCSANVNITDKQRLAIFTGPGTAPISSAAGFNGDVFTIQGSTGIFLGNLDISGGSRGIVIFRSSELTIEGSSVFGNRNAGIRMDGHSNLFLIANIHNNGGAGVNMFDSLVTAENSQFTGNGGTGVFLTRSRGFFQGDTLNNNGNGIVFAEDSSGQFTAPNSIQNNGSIGVSVEDGSAVRIFGSAAQSNNIDGNSLIGLNIFSAHVALFSNNTIRNNGASGEAFNAGVRVDDNGVLFTSANPGEIQITGNTGPGIDSTLGGDVDLTGVVIGNNTGDGIRGQGHVHIGFFPPNTNAITGNGGRSILCDDSSVFMGDRTGVKDIQCEVIPFISPGAQGNHRRMHDSDKDNN